MPRTVEEVLYPALEDFKLDVVLGKGPSARSIRLDLPRFTLVAATTRPGRITLPLRERFGFSPRLDYYSRGRPRDDRAALAPASSAWRSTPEGAGRDRPPLPGHPADREPAAPPRPRLRRGPPRRRDHGDVARGGLELFEVDEEGLDKLDLAILRAIVEKFGGGPVGLSTLAAAVGEEPDTVEDVEEPYLLQLGFLKRTPRGRVATERAYRAPRHQRAGHAPARLRLVPRHRAGRLGLSRLPSTPCTAEDLGRPMFLARQSSGGGSVSPARCSW